ncbi:S-adenosyl-L-methionine-dependent methyltransferase [Teratosphaeria nubilosa]|uniref:S-adenosyl-L-methionine-dependent methyltransferase n=1 Tax=Teratosphaeria nubilosa TaxID=161662 RepID=A0A6G1L018_9PEZI|nr:S-adenosyl-L-methionine-dependent methyltransferase [Teratosphaeria nubilosa]
MAQRPESHDSGVFTLSDVSDQPGSSAREASISPQAEARDPEQLPDAADPLPGQPIEAIDSQSESGDSGYDEKSLSTASLRSSIFDYEHEFGRSYHSFRRGKYVIPNDEREQDRMDIHYHALRLTLENKHFIAPIESPTGILDVGTGTGIWAMDVADDFPGAHVVGIDLSPIQPTAVPPNAEFQIMDADEEWDFGPRFDFVHTRFMGGFCVKSWPHFYEQAFQSLQPGGWVENQEFDVHFGCDDGTLPANSSANQWAELWGQGIRKLGLESRMFPERMLQQMRDVGFINVTYKEYKMPIGEWPKNKRLRKSGLFNLIGMIDGLSGLTVKTFTHGLGWSEEEIEILVAKVKSELQNRRIHTYFPIHVLYAQKPPT